MIQDRNQRLRVKSLSWWESDIWWERFCEVAPKTELIYFTGGEPFLVPMHDQILQHLVDTNLAKNIVLQYHTNLSVINNKVLQLLKNFRRVDMRISVDDTDERYYIIRNPGNYQTLLKNIFRVKQIGLHIGDINGCIGLSTIYSSLRLTPLAKKIKTKYFYRFLYAPTNQSLANLPASAKREIISVYRQNLDTAGEAGEAVIKFLEQYMDQENLDEIASYVRYMDHLDQLRGTNWHTTLSDVYELLLKHCPSAFSKK